MPKVHTVFAPGVRSYRIQSYRSPAGEEVARVEIALIKGANVTVNDVEGGVRLNVTGAPARVPSKEDIAARGQRCSRQRSIIDHCPCAGNLSFPGHGWIER